MANIKSQKKRIITNEKARLRNRAVRSELKTATRAVHDAVEAKNGAEAYAAALAACRLLDRAVTKGDMLHLFGYDHMEEDERQVMEAKQREIMEKVQISR